MSARVQYEDSSITLERKAMALTDAIPRETRNLEDLLEAEIGTYLTVPPTQGWC